MDRQRRPGLVGGHRGGRHRPGRVVPGRAVPASRSRHPCRGPFPCGAGREPLPRQGPPTNTERDARSSGPQSRPAVSDPQAAPRRPNASTNAATTGCCSGCVSVTLTTRSSAPGSRRRTCATSTSPTTPTTPRCCWTRPSPGAPPTTSPRSNHSVAPSPCGERDPRPPHHRRVQRPDRGPEPLRQEGQALRPRLPHPSRTTASASCSTPAASPGPAPVTTTHQNPRSLLRTRRAGLGRNSGLGSTATSASAKDALHARITRQVLCLVVRPSRRDDRADLLSRRRPL